MQTRLQKYGRSIWNARYLYLLMLPALLYLAVFDYGPMGGVLLAFKKYNAKLGIFGSKWVGMDHFRRIFSTPEAVTAIINTLEINICRLLFQFPVPIVLALMLNEMPGRRVKRVYQTIFTFPHFLSWIVVSTILINFMSNGGMINNILSSLGAQRIDFLADATIFRPILYITQNWKEMGWSSIIYIAAIAGIDLSLYEAATVDGAGRLRQIWHVTLPGIRSTIVVLFILQVGRIMNSGFEQIFYLQNPGVKQVADILDTYIYRITFDAVPNYGFSTAVGLFKSVINLIMLIVANRVVKLVNETGLFA